jgi:hypothetical protein
MLARISRVVLANLVEAVEAGMRAPIHETVVVVVRLFLL